MSELQKKISKRAEYISDADAAAATVRQMDEQISELENDTESSIAKISKKAAKLNSEKFEADFIHKTCLKRAKALDAEIKQLYDEAERAHDGEEKAQKSARRELARADMEADNFQGLIDRAKTTYYLLDSAHYLEWKDHILSYFPKTYDRQEGATLAAELFPDAPQLPEYPEKLQQARRLLNDIQEEERERMFPTIGRTI